MHSFKRFLFILLFSPSILFSTIYEDAEDNKTTRWSLLQANGFGKIKNINDTDKKSRVIQLIGDHTKSTYILTLARKNIDQDYANLSWEMKYTEDFVIMIRVNTTRGKHTLIYTPGNENSYLQYGLGQTATHGQWKTYQRNLEQDLNNFVKGSKILEIKIFVVKGSGFFDNIKLLDTKKEVQKIEKKKPVEKKLELRLKNVNKKTNSMPTIHLNGPNPLLLQKGALYIEKGATAIGKDDVELDIDICHQIDTFREGEYLVIYMTTNNMGNSVIDTRRVIVGKVSKQQQRNTQRTPNSEASLKLEQRSEQLSAWEKELEAREEELVTQEIINKNTIN